MNWKEVSVEVANQAAPAVSNIMNELGSGGVVTEERDEQVIITAYYYNDKDFPKLLEELKQRIYNLSDYNIEIGEVKISISDKQNEDWATSWHQYFKPLEIGENFLVTPSWEDVKEDKRQIIKIDPGMAFGIGGHETTQMCVKLLEKYIDYLNNLKRDTSNGNNISEINELRNSKYSQERNQDSEDTKTTNMLDIGTGTGILAVAAAYLGVSDIIGIDIDPAAVSAAKENIRINEVHDKIRIIKGDMAKDIDGTYSIITANLLPDLIMNLLPSVPPLMDNNSLLILSGIIQQKKELIINSLNQVDMKVIDEDKMGEWVSLVAVKKRVK